MSAPKHPLHTNQSSRTVLVDLPALLQITGRIGERFDPAAEAAVQQEAEERSLQDSVCRMLYDDEVY